MPSVTIWGPTGEVELSIGQQAVLELPAWSPEGGMSCYVALTLYDGDFESVAFDFPTSTAVAGQPFVVTLIASYSAVSGATATYELTSALDGGETSYTVSSQGGFAEAVTCGSCASRVTGWSAQSFFSRPFVTAL